MTQPEPVKYQVAYLWTCPDCGTVWQLRHRPRAGAQLVCAAAPEQRPAGKVTSSYTCATVHTSAGRRGGIAPNVSI